MFQSVDDLRLYVCSRSWCNTDSWFKVAVSAADSAGTETDRSRRLGSDSSNTRKMLHRKLKKF